MRKSFIRLVSLSVGIALLAVVVVVPSERRPRVCHPVPCAQEKPVVFSFYGIEHGAMMAYWYFRNNYPKKWVRWMVRDAQPAPVVAMYGVEQLGFLIYWVGRSPRVVFRKKA